MLTVSRSVDRVFHIMELFAARRRPLSATEIHQALNLPHSSAVSVLSRLTDLGYLEQHSETKRFFPSLRLRHLCMGIPDAIVGGNPIADLADRVHYATDETASISRLDGLFTMPIYVRTAQHAKAWRVTPGLSGGLATLSVVGRTLLSTLSAPELQRFVQRANFWGKRTRQATIADPEELMRAIEFVREHGYLCRYNLLFPGIGAISAPLPDCGGGERLAVTIAGSVDRIQERGRHIIKTLLQEVRALAHANSQRAKPASATATAAAVSAVAATAAAATATVTAVAIEREAVNS